MSGGDIQNSVALASHDQWRRLDVDRSERCAAKPETLGGDVFPSPQRREHPAAGLQPVQAVLEPREGDPSDLVVVAGEVVRTGTEAHFEAAVTRGLSHRDLGGKEEWVSQRRVQDVDAQWVP